MNRYAPLIFTLVLYPVLAFASGSWQVIDTTGTEQPGDEAYACLVTPRAWENGIYSIEELHVPTHIMIFHRRGDAYPMVYFATTDRGAYSFRYVIDHPKIEEQVIEILPKRGSLFINGPDAVEFIELLKKGNQIRYLISSSEREYETRVISLIGFTKTYNSINNCVE